MRFKQFCFVVGLVVSLFTTNTASAFSLLGPEESWQTPVLNYRQPGDIGGWMNIGEEYRWNIPVITYGFDSSFANYFGTNGIRAVEEAIAILNDLPNASDINLDDFPLNSQRFNYQAQALQLFDVKSAALGILLEEMGLANPDVGVWRLRDRWITANNTITNYLVTQRNFDPYTYQPSSYINGVLYTYNTIIDIQPPNPGAFPLVTTVDPIERGPSSSVAAWNLFPGGFYTGLTRDDVGGLKYLFRSNNFNVERLLPDVEIISTNYLNPVQLQTLDLAEFTLNTQNTTNRPVDLYSLYTSNLVITATNAFVAQVIETNYFTYFTNYPWAPQQIIEEIYTTNTVTLYTYDFGNVVTNAVYTDRPVFVRILDLVPALDYMPGMPNVRTNIIDEYFDTQFITNGEFYIVPTNLVGYAFNGIDALYTNVTATTNVDFFAEALLTIRTNTGRLELLNTYDLTTFTEQARTNNPATLLSLYSNLLILATNQYYTNVVSSNVVSYLTNSPWDPAIIYSIADQVIYTTNIATNYAYVFGNVVTNFGDTGSVTSNGTVIVDEYILAPNPYDPAGSPFETNIIRTIVETNLPVGNMYIVPTNLFGYHIISTQLVDVVAVTNTLIVTNFGIGAIEQTNTISYIRFETNYYLNALPIEFVTTNELATNIFGIRRETVVYSTNRVFEVYPIQALSTGTNRAPALRPGVEKVTFVRVDYDSMLGQTFLTQTNEYLDSIIVSNRVEQQLVRRVNVRPDIVFSAADVNRNIMARTATRDAAFNPIWDNNDFLNGQADLAGPGVIRPQIEITFNSTFPHYYNFNALANNGTFFLNQPSLGYLLNDFRQMTVAWASFDGSTNAPVLYPAGASLAELENAILNR